MSQVKNLPGLARAHLEPRFGTALQASEYCKKDGLFWEAGCMKANRDTQSNNLMGIQLKLMTDAIRNGATDAQLIDEYIVCYAKHLKFVDKVRESVIPGYREQLDVVLLYGLPGTGKTLWCYEQDPTLYSLPVKGGKNMWFNGYRGQRTVLIDEFSGKMGLDELLLLLDKYPIQTETKGGFTWFNPTTIYVTTNCHIDDWYDYSKRAHSKAALKRRFTSFLYCERHNNGAYTHYTRQRCDSSFIPLRDVDIMVGVEVTPEDSDDDLRQFM